MEVRPRYRRGPGGRGGLAAARHATGREERPRAWAFGGRLRPGCPQSPYATSFSRPLRTGPLGSFWRPASPVNRALALGSGPPVERPRLWNGTAGWGIRVGWDLQEPGCRARTPRWRGRPVSGAVGAGASFQGQRAAPGCVSSSVLSREPTEQVLGSEDLERRKGLHS